VAWRYCQLLTALPNRGAEAAAWGGAAQEVWARGGGGAGFGGSPIQAVLGDDVALKGQGQHGAAGVVVSLAARRLLRQL
jgi:hypothetical protein